MVANSAVTRVLLGVRGMSKEAGLRVSDALKEIEGVSKAIPDDGQLEVHLRPNSTDHNGLSAGHSCTGFFSRHDLSFDALT